MQERHAFTAHVSRLAAAVVLVLALTALASSNPAHAGGATFNVNINLDAPDNNPGDGFCDKGSFLCTLRAAVMEANALPGPDTINLSSDTYLIQLSGADNTAVAGDLDITDDLTIEGLGPGSTIIDAGGIDRVFHVDVNQTGINVQINNLTIRNGSASYGGGIWQLDGSLTLNNVDLSNNSASFNGGAIDTRSELTYDGGTISGNSAGSYGGGIDFGVGGSGTLTNVTVSGNQAAPGAVPGSSVGGGGLAGGPAAITDSLISGNTTGSQGGGIRGSGFTITNTTFTGNAGGEGGGIFTSGGADTSVTASTFSGNSATSGNGGGIYNNSGTLSIDRSTFIGNSATGSGGGIKNEATAAVTNTTVSGNSAPSGGGLDNRNTLTVTNVTVAGNTASSGGGIWAFDATVVNTIFANNVAGGDCFITVGITSSHSLDSDGSCGLTGPGDIPNTDPFLGPLGNYGGATDVYPLRSHSPAVDAGDGTACSFTDQRGGIRPQDGDDDLFADCDIGAFELQPVCAGDGAVFSPSDVAIPDNDPGGVSSTVGYIGPGLGEIADLNLCVAVPHTWVGDLIVTLTHVDTGTTATLIDRPGRTNGGEGCNGDDMFVLLDDEAGSPVENECGTQIPSIAGNFVPNSPLSVFDGEDLAGDWRLTVSDNAADDTGVLDRWDLLPQLVPTTPTPTPSAATATPTPTPGAATPTATPVGQTPTPTGTAQGGDDRIWGDDNCSGSADPVDSLLTLRFDAGLSANTGDCPEMGQVVDVQSASAHPWGDVDCGGDVTPVDSLKLLRYDAGLSVTKAVGCPEIGSEVTIVE